MSILLAVAAQSGCGTIEGMAAPEGESRILIGVRRDIEHVVGERHVGNSCLDLSALFLPFYLIDTPISLGVDLVLFPYVLITEITAPSHPPLKPLDPTKGATSMPRPNSPEEERRDW